MFVCVCPAVSQVCDHDHTITWSRDQRSERGSRALPRWVHSGQLADANVDPLYCLEPPLADPRGLLPVPGAQRANKSCPVEVVRHFLDGACARDVPCRMPPTPFATTSRPNWLSTRRSLTLVPGPTGHSGGLGGMVSTVPSKVTMINRSWLLGTTR